MRVIELVRELSKRQPLVALRCSHVTTTRFSCAPLPPQNFWIPIGGIAHEGMEEYSSTMSFSASDLDHALKPTFADASLVDSYVESNKVAHMSNDSSSNMIRIFPITRIRYRNTTTITMETAQVGKK